MFVGRVVTAAPRRTKIGEMSYSRDEIKQITDKVLNMCKADAVEVRFSGGERSATRFANSSITANLIEHDQEISITVRYGQKSASATTHQTDDETLKRTIDAVQMLARRKPENPELMPLVKPPQTYIEVDAALPSAVNFGPAERARMARRHVPDLIELLGSEDLRTRFLAEMCLRDATNT